MLAERAPAPFEDPDYFFELKWDGTRCLAFVEGDRVRLQNRRLRDITYRYPELQSLYQWIQARRIILDGEIVVLRGGRPDFKKLQQREQAEHPLRIQLLSRQLPAVYVVFDLLYQDTGPVWGKPLEERRWRLQEILMEGEHLVLSRAYPRGRDLYREALRQGFEGIMAKKRTSLYRPGIRSSEWLKIKRALEVDAVICGWLVSDKRPFASLVLGLYRGKDLLHLGQVGTGFDREEMETLSRILRNLRISYPHFSLQTVRPVEWVRPELVARVRAQELTPDGKLRAPVFLGLREDKDPAECTVEQLSRLFNAGKD